MTTKINYVVLIPTSISFLFCRIIAAPIAINNELIPMLASFEVLISFCVVHLYHRVRPLISSLLHNNTISPAVSKTTGNYDTPCFSRPIKSVLHSPRYPCYRTSVRDCFGMTSLSRVAIWSSVNDLSESDDKNKSLFN